MRNVFSISNIILTLVVLILHFSDIGQFAVRAVIANPFVCSCFCAFGWLSMLVLFLTIVQAVLSIICGK